MTEPVLPKILFVDMMSPPGHMDVNHFFIKYVFRHFNNYYYLLDRDLYEKMCSHYSCDEKPAATYFPFQHASSASSVSARVLLHKKVKYILEFVQKNDITCIFFLSYDTLSLSFHMNKFKCYQVILMNHDNIARFTKNALKRFVLRRLNGFVHVVYSPPDDTSVASRLHQGLQFKKILLIEHHLDERWKITGRKPYTPDSVSLYAPSNGNDDVKNISFIECVKNGAVTVRAKVKGRTYDKYKDLLGSSLFSGFISTDEYETEMNRADFILLFYPDDYYLRTSGVLFDAIAFAKPVITDNSFLYETYIKKKGLGIFVDNVCAAGKVISKIDSALYGKLVGNVQNYKRSYSPEKIGSEFASKISQVMGK